MDKIVFVVGFFSGVVIVTAYILQNAEILAFFGGFLVAFIVVSWLIGRDENAGDNTRDYRNGQRYDFGGDDLAG
jgi:hypothetical protein